MTVEIKTIETEQKNILLRNIKNDRIKLLNKIDNPLDINYYSKKITDLLSANYYDLLILTTDEYKNSFEPLKNAHDNNGIKTEIKTLSDISIISGSVTPEEIRDFIRNEYLNSGIEYVLLGGDVDVIPAKNLYLGYYNNNYYSGPSDLYYACLDGEYNSDGDDKWGEPNDGDNGGDVDLIAEIYIGRACIESISEVNNFVEKTIKQIELYNFTNQILMVGEKLSSKPITWGGDYLDEIIDGSNNNSIITTGFPQNDTEIETLYERDSPNNDWQTSDIIDSINDEPYIINHMGHSSLEYSMKLHNYDINLFTNDEPFFVYSQGCTAGGFDYNDCIAENFIVKTEYGAFAGIWNARFGWYSLGSTDGASQRFQREFWDAVFGENINEIGKANQDSKEDLLYQINYPYTRWCYYELNLLGDPALSIYISNNDNNPPDKPQKPSKVRTFDGYSFSTYSNDYERDMIFYRWDFGDGTFSDWLGPYNSDEEADVLHNWSKFGIYTIRVKARDEHREESEWSDKLVILTPLYKEKFNLLNIIIEFFEKYFPKK